MNKFGNGTQSVERVAEVEGDLAGVPDHLLESWSTHNAENVAFGVAKLSAPEGVNIQSWGENEVDRYFDHGGKFPSGPEQSERPDQQDKPAEQEDLSGKIRWFVDLSRWEPLDGSNGAEFKFLLSLVQPEEQPQVLRYVKPDDQKRALMSRLLARRACSVCLDMPQDTVKMARTRGSKPFLSNPPTDRKHRNFNFNCSHEGHLVVAAAEPVALCGIDVAAPQQVRGNSCVEDLSHPSVGIFSNSEYETLSTQYGQDKENTFRKLWSCKEAFVKARGDGLALELNRADFELTPAGEGSWKATVRLDGVPKTNWAFHVQHLRAEHYVTVSRGPPEEAIDANGVFSKTLEQRQFTEAEWSAVLESGFPEFQELTVEDLVPEDKKSTYRSILDEEAGW